MFSSFREKRKGVWIRMCAGRACYAIESIQESHHRRTETFSRSLKPGILKLAPLLWPPKGERR